MTELAQLDRHEDVAVITISNPPVNALSPGVPEGIQAAMDSAVKDPQIRAIVIAGCGRNFCAGADIREIEKIIAGEKPIEKLLPLSFLLAIEDCPKPVVMAIHGSALGGGLEMAMAGHYRMAVPGAHLGQTEVNLGLIPGAGGTQRLPRLAGIAKAVEMCAFGEPIGAREALDFGIVDRLAEGDLLADAVEFAREIAGKPVSRTRDRNNKLPDADPAVFASARDRASKTRRGQMAPLAAINAVEAAASLPFVEGCQKEAELFRGCLFSTQSQALLHAFLSERAASKIPNLPREASADEIHRAAVIGAGTMGGGIAMAFANAGIPVIVREASREALDRGMATIRQNYSSSVKKGRFSQTTMDQCMSLITPQLNYDGFQESDVIVEAVFEDMTVKRHVFSEIDEIAKPSCILASNTSTLDIDELASVTKCSAMVIGLHFFSPANVMRLLEIVRGRYTSKDVIATSMALAKRLGKVAVLAENGRGFIGNRTLAPYSREAEFLLEEGASVEEVNQALYDFGMAMGPLAMADLIGLDVWRMIRGELKHLEAPGVRQPLVLDRLCDEGRFGQKAGRGYSRYAGNHRANPDPETAVLIDETARKAGIERRRVAPEEIVYRCVYALINECARVLEEGVALRAADIDVVYLLGFGFPAWRGGPLFYADTVGLKNVVARMAEFESKHGAGLWAPTPLLKKLAESGGTFAALDADTRAPA